MNTLHKRDDDDDNNKITVVITVIQFNTIECLLYLHADLTAFLTGFKDNTRTKMLITNSGQGKSQDK
jgi:hypothetical protein